MDEKESGRFFDTFKSIIDSVVAEKRQKEQWRRKLQQFQAVVQFRLRITQDDIFYCHLIAKDGEFKLEMGPAETYDLELAATPEDLMYFTNKHFSTANMIMQKNVYGQRRLQVKKGGRNLGKLMALAKILVLE